MARQSLAFSRSDVVEKRPEALIKEIGMRKIGRMSGSGYLNKAGARNLLRHVLRTSHKIHVCLTDDHKSRDGDRRQGFEHMGISLNQHSPRGVDEAGCASVCF